MMKTLFYNASEQRLRAGWRILLFLITFYTLAASVFLIKPLLGEISKRTFVEDYSVLIVTILLIAAVIATRLGRYILDRKSFKSIGLDLETGWIKDVLFGITLSALMAGTFLMVAAWAGWVTISDIAAFDSTMAFSIHGLGDFLSHMSWMVLLILFMEMVAVGFWEELVFRGYLFQNMREGMGLISAIVVSCLIYGMIHSMNPNAGWLSTSIIVLFGFLRIYGYLLTDQLWLSIGMHIGWNFFQGPVFGFAASGHKNATILQLEIAAPHYLSGGNFGPEGSIVVIPIVLLALGAMYLWSRRTKKSF